MLLLKPSLTIAQCRCSLLCAINEQKEIENCSVTYGIHTYFNISETNTAIQPPFALGTGFPTQENAKVNYCYSITIMQYLTMCRFSQCLLPS